MDRDAVRRFVAGHRLAAERAAAERRVAPLDATARWEAAAAIFDLLAELGPIDPALAARRREEDAAVRSIWARLRAALPR
jgi:hypothetical protein